MKANNKDRLKLDKLMIDRDSGCVMNHYNHTFRISVNKIKFWYKERGKLE